MAFLPDDLLKVVGGVSLEQAALKDEGVQQTPKKKFYQNVLQSRAAGLPSTQAIKDLYADDSSLSEVADFYSLVIGDGPTNPMKNAIRQEFSASLASCVSKGVKLENKDFSVALIKASSVSLTEADSRKVTVFMNSLPNAVASSLIPYFEVEFEFSYNGGTLNGVGLQPPGLLRFLLDRDGSELASSDKKLLSATTVSSGSSSRNLRDSAFFGMEMFTSPATLTNPSAKGFYVKPLNPFAPFASLTSAEVSVQSSGKGQGLNSFKTAKLMLTIHDKTRLGDIAELIKPELFSRNTVWLTYGWRLNNYAGSLSDDYTKFINENMLVKEAYTVKNASYGVEGTQAKVTLELSTKGSNELATFSLADVVGNSASYSIRSVGVTPNGEKTLEDLRNEILRSANFLQEKINGPTQKVEIMGNQLIKAVDSLDFPELKSDTKNLIKQLIAQLDARSKTFSDENQKSAVKQSVKDLETALGVYFQKKGNDYTIRSDFKRSVGGNISKIMDVVLSQEADDPFLKETFKKVLGFKDSSALSPTGAASEYKKAGKPSGGKRVPYKRVASYGSLFSAFVGMAGLKIPTTSDLQIFFYNIRSESYSENGRLLNIAEFPIDVAEFIDDYEKACLAAQGESLTIQDLIQLLNSQVEDSRGLAYDLRQHYVPGKKGADKKLLPGKESNASLKVDLDKKMPIIGVKVETRAANRLQTGGADLLLRLQSSAAERLKEGGSSRQVMRIHVFDRNNTDYLASELAQAQSARLQKISGGKATKESIQQYLRESGFPADLIQIKKVEGSEKYYVSFTNSAAVRDFFSRAIPTIIAGAEGSAVTSLTVETNGVDPLQQASIIVKSKTGGLPNQPLSTSGINGLPLTVFPANVSMTSLGCPLMSFGQVFYVDFGTGTTLDNTYRVTGLNHTFAPGRFHTQAKLSFDNAVGSYNVEREAGDLLKLIQKTTLG